MTKPLIVPYVSGFEEIEASAGDVVPCIDRQEKSPDCTEAGFLIGHNDETPDFHGSESSGTLVPSTDLRQIVSSFDIKGEIESIKPLGNGLINDTYLATTAGEGPDYVLQRINNAVFKDVELLQRNLETITDYLRSKGVRTLKFLPLKDGSATYCFRNGKFWRVSEFISNSFTYESVTPEYSGICGKTFGNFESLLTDIPYRIGETIPDFHNIELRVNQLKDAAKADAAGRLSDQEAKDILGTLLDYADEMCKSERLYREGELPKRICHCDTKVNNMLFDADGNVICVIDLDTTMPSFIFSDYGDFLRTAANFVAEDDPNVSNVGFNMEIFKAFTEGYLESASSFLTPIEKENLPYAACLFPYMQAVRFFTDYLNGDTYYRIMYPEHNLVRTRNQLALFKSAMKKVPLMKEFILTLEKKS
ncbi:MAG: phosphotransferase [Bacteroidales bacterium]|nr:phosphotransferase [Candidatus Cacconaster caballi]